MMTIELSVYLPPHVQESVLEDLASISTLSLSPSVAAWCYNAETHLPSVRQNDTWGRPTSHLITSEGWRNLQTRGQAEGLVAIGYERLYAQYSRVYQFLKYHVWIPVCAFTLCPAAMTDGAARLLYLQLQKEELGAKEKIIFQAAYDRLTARDANRVWTSGQWMTERAGGSDVRETETQATYSPLASSDHSNGGASDGDIGPWSISGFKWFSSATDANVTVLLAKEPSGLISAFFAPTRHSSTAGTDSAMNGISIQKLKNKLGTKALPTAELVLNGMRAWRIGASGQGVKNISTILNITRVHNAVSAVALWSRGLAVSRAFAKVRKSRGQLLMNTQAHVATMAAQVVEHKAMMHLAFLAVTLLGADENSTQLSKREPSAFEASGLISQDSVPHLLRIVTPLAKMLTAKAAISGLQECMESLGGVGYLENEDISFNIARLYRDANVLSIWEGTTNIMADDVVRIVTGPFGAQSLRALDLFVGRAVEHWKLKSETACAEALSSGWTTVRAVLTEHTKSDLLMSGRALSKDLGWLICAVLLGEEALNNSDEIAYEIFRRWTLERDSKSYQMPASRRPHWDKVIVFGDHGVAGAFAKL